MHNIAQNPFINTSLNKVVSEEAVMVHLRRIRRFGEAADCGLRSCFDKNAGLEMVQPKPS